MRDYDKKGKDFMKKLLGCILLCCALVTIQAQSDTRNFILDNISLNTGYSPALQVAKDFGGVTYILQGMQTNADVFFTDTKIGELGAGLSFRWDKSNHDLYGQPLQSQSFQIQPRFVHKWDGVVEHSSLVSHFGVGLNVQSLKYNWQETLIDSAVFLSLGSAVRAGLNEHWYVQGALEYMVILPRDTVIHKILLPVLSVGYKF